ncbi:MAG: transcriptional repressor [Ignavibacteria bacterium]|nr:transcriptional repressor [Ignavibacteria bacterium]
MNKTSVKNNNVNFDSGDIAEFRSILNSYSLKITKPRIEIMKILKSNHKPLTISEISGRLTGKKTDLVTVYRTLNLFEELGIVSQIDFKDEFKRYELIYDRHHHHHIVCRKCKKVENVETCLLDGIEKILIKTGYTEITHSLEFFGICRNCKTK